MTRPDFNTDKLPPALAPAMLAKANRSWCVRDDYGQTFFVDEDKAHRMVKKLADEGQAPLIWPPIS